VLVWKTKIVENGEISEYRGYSKANQFSRYIIHNVVLYNSVYFIANNVGLAFVTIKHSIRFESH